MSSDKKNSATDILLGELLVKAGMLTQTELDEALRQASGKKLQLGQILVIYGYLKAADLQCALDAQSMIRDRSVDLPLALRFLKIASKTGGTASDINVQTFSRALTGKLGELLLESGLISSDQFGKALRRSLNSGLPIGRMLILSEALTQDQLNQALEVQKRLRDSVITRESAVELLRAAADSASRALPVVSTKQDSSSLPPKRHVVRLGELMVLGGVLTEGDVMDALESGLKNSKPVGEVLVNKGLVTDQLIDAALELQQRIDNNELAVVQASEILARIKSTGDSIDEVLIVSREELESDKIVLNYERLLTLAQVVSDEDINSAFDLSSKSAHIVGRVLLLTGFIDEPTMQATLRCHQLLSSGAISQDDAIAAMIFWSSRKNKLKLSFDDALNELGWSARQNLRLDEEDDGESNAQAKSLCESFIKLAAVYNQQGKYADAQALYERILVYRLKKVGPDHPELIPDLSNLAAVLSAQGRFSQAEAFMQRVVSITEQQERPHSLDLADAVSLLGQIYLQQDKFVEAESRLARALDLRQQILNPGSPDLRESMVDYAKVLKKLGRLEEAEKFLQMAKAQDNQHREAAISP